MLQYVKASKLTTLAAIASLLALSFLIFGCGDDEPELTPQPPPAPAPIDISAMQGAAAPLWQWWIAPWLQRPLRE